jgi:hypothetical protein
MNPVIICRDEWLSLVPNYSREPFHVTQFSSFIHIGTTISLVPCDDCPPDLISSTSNLVYATILSYDNNHPGERTVTLNLFPHFKKIFLQEQLPSSWGNMEFIPVVVQTRLVIVVPVSYIIDICFIFSTKDIASGTIFCEDISIAFITRFRCTFMPNIQEQIICDDYYCFP